MWAVLILIRLSNATHDRITANGITFFPTSSEPISLSHRTAFAPLIVAIFNTVSAGRAVGFVVPVMYASRPLLIRQARYISSTAHTGTYVNVLYTMIYRSISADTVVDNKVIKKLPGNLKRKDGYDLESSRVCNLCAKIF